MLRSIVFSLLTLIPSAALALCDGNDIIDAMPEAARATLQAEVDAMPYPTGIYWKATRGDQTITMFGTYHFRHAQTDAHLAMLKPQIDASDAVFLELSKTQMETAQKEIANDPSIMFIVDGPTLPDLLGEEDWVMYREAMLERGMPGFMSSKLKPIWAAMLLGIGPCEAQNGTDEEDGIDELIATYADDQGNISRSLERFRDVLAMLDDQPLEKQVEMIRMTLAYPEDPDDMAYTVRERYLNEEVALMWLFFRDATLKYGGPTAEEDFEQFEKAILTDRNVAWVDLLVGLEEQNIFAAFGAGHLPGELGVLYLLEQQGFEITQLPVAP